MTAAQSDPTFARALGAHQSGRFGEAEALYETILRNDPQHGAATHLLGVIRAQQGRSAEALALMQRALAQNRQNPDLLANTGNVFKAMGRFEEALAHFDEALTLDANHLAALHNRGLLLHQRKDFAGALTCFDRLLQARPDHAQSWNLRGNTLRQLKRLPEALQSYDRALALNPEDAVAHNNRGNALGDLGRFDEALAGYRSALAIAPNYVTALINAGQAAQRLGRFGLALDLFERAHGIDPAEPHALGGAAAAALKLCDWEKLAALNRQIRGAENCVLAPFVALALEDDPDTLLQIAKTFIRDRIPAKPAPLWNGTRYRHPKTRLAYLSPDFRAHAVSFQAVELFERHDRAKFDVIGISLAPDDGSDFGHRVRKAFDEFHDLGSRSDLEIARLLREMEIDIAIDLGGLTQDCRPEILSHRPAPVQVNYLGYAGSMAADFIDYVIGDAVALPLSLQPCFTERIVHLPGCFMVNSGKGEPRPGVTRAELGLPENAFVFCNFGNSWKIGQSIFDAWLRLLAAVPGSVLWLKESAEAIRARLRAQARGHGIDPTRILFSTRVERDLYLAQFTQADLFLDTHPFNAHATASDALAMGLPVLTVTGRGFAARVASSLVHLAGIPELATADLGDYERLAIRFAGDDAVRRRIKAQLQEGRASFFNAANTCRSLEAAFAQMRQIVESGRFPHDFRA